MLVTWSQYFLIVSQFFSYNASVAASVNSVRSMVLRSLITANVEIS